MSRYIKTHRSKDLKRSVLVISQYLINEIKKHKDYKLNNYYFFKILQKTVNQTATTFI